jgi:hypothetical protein
MACHWLVTWIVSHATMSNGLSLIGHLNCVTCHNVQWFVTDWSLELCHMPQCPMACHWLVTWIVSHATMSNGLSLIGHLNCVTCHNVQLTFDVWWINEQKHLKRSNKHKYLNKDWSEIKLQLKMLFSVIKKSFKTVWVLFPFENLNTISIYLWSLSEEQASILLKVMQGQSHLYPIIISNHNNRCLLHYLGDWRLTQPFLWCIFLEFLLVN